MTPIRFAQSLAASGRREDQALGVAIVARGLADDDGSRQGWPMAVAIPAAIEYLGLTSSAELAAHAATIAPTVSDAMLNRSADR